jgi:hypothetical protein
MGQRVRRRRDEAVLDPDKLEAVVIDTNAQSDGHPDLAAIEDLAKDLATEDIEVVLPEVVAWEFAEHVASTFEELRTSYRSAARTLVRAGLPLPQLPSDSRERVQEMILQQLEAIEGLHMLPTTPGSAREGLRDQVLQRGLGSTRAGVKTGAADSAWLRDVHNRWPDHQMLVIASSDAGVRAAATELWDSSPAFVSDLFMLRRRLLVHPTDLPGATADIVEFVANLGRADPFEEALLLGDMTPSPPVLDELFGEHASDEIVQVDASPSSFGPLVGLHGVKASGTRGTVTAEVFLSATVDLVAWRLDNDGRLESRFATLFDVVLASEVVFRRESGSISDGVAEGLLRVIRDKALYAESFDAAIEFFEVLSLFPGVGVEAPAIGDRLTIPIVATGAANLAVEFDWDDDGWRAAVALPNGSSAVLTCAYDPTLRVWDGDEGFDIDGPYRLSTDSALLAWNPLWSLNAVLAEFIDVDVVRSGCGSVVRNDEPKDRGDSVS